MQEGKEREAYEYRGRSAENTCREEVRRRGGGRDSWQRRQLDVEREEGAQIIDFEWRKREETK